MLSACDIYVYKKKFHSKENFYLQILLVLKLF